jgi:hypothetical protein
MHMKPNLRHALLLLALASGSSARIAAAEPKEHAHAKGEAHEKVAEAQEDLDKAGKHMGEAMKAANQDAREAMQKAHDDAHEAMKDAQEQAHDALKRAGDQAQDLMKDAHEHALVAMKEAHEAMGKAIGLEERGAAAAHARHDMFMRMRMHHIDKPEDVPADVRAEQTQHARRMARLARAGTVAEEQKDEKSHARAQELMEHEIARHTQRMDALWHEHDAEHTEKAEEKKP